MNPRIKLPVMLTRKICHGQELLFGSISSNPHRETAPAIPPKATKRIVLISTGKNVTTSQKVFGDVNPIHIFRRKQFNFFASKGMCKDGE